VVPTVRHAVLFVLGILTHEPCAVIDLMTRLRLPDKFGPGYLEPFLMFQNVLKTEYKQAQFFFES
jgi:hypothetical protein